MRFQLKDIGLNSDRQMLTIESKKELMCLPHPYEKEEGAPIKPLTEEQKRKYEWTLDGVTALLLPKPKSKEEEERLVKSFLNGLKKLLSKEDNWTFVQILKLTLDYCASCQTCSQACMIYQSSNGKEIYQPAYRAELLRRIIKKYIYGQSGFAGWFTGSGDIELNWTTVARLAELAYRCTVCRRCSQWCPLGLDNGLVTRELRKLFSQEMGIAPKEFHDLGTVKQLTVGASTGTTPKALQSMINFIEMDIEDKTGMKIKIPVDKAGADILLTHNTGEFISWPENPAAFAIIFEAAGINWTLSSEIGGYEATNYGAFYDDIQLARILIKQMMAAKKLGAKKIVVGECGHAHKVLMVIADWLLPPDLRIPRESYLPLLEEIVINGKIKLDPSKNDFPLTLQDPCNLARLMGIVEPQRRILKKICPQFREMEPHGVYNYCCGGGSGFAIVNPLNFPDWKMNISGRMKFKQILDAFQDVISPEIKKYVCAPCSNCKGQIRDLLTYYNAWDKCSIWYGGLVELVVNAMADIKQPYITWPS